ncbi:MAG: hypothetical protein IJ189_05530 [Clostridia bacterium]|nr:hypothetical protein [Clostridia bacterium]
MTLYWEILLHLWKCQGTDTLCEDPEAIVGNVCYQAMKKIQTIIRDDCLDDPECFRRMEDIVRVFEEMGSDGGSRHDFG